MNKFWIMALVLAAAAARPGEAGANVPDGAACGAAGQAAERVAGLPANMLLSVGLVESGRLGTGGGAMAPWPWTVNVDGAGRFFDSKPAAIAFVQAAQSAGAGDIDVGCFQVSLRYHPDAFGSLEEAFDPATNARAAAAFLSQLKGQAGSWPLAIADYHSAVATLGLPYQRRVLAAWAGLGDAPDFASAAADDPVSDGLVADPVVVELAPPARLVRVFTMADPAVAGLRPGLPRVISP